MAIQKAPPSGKVLVFVDNRELKSTVTEHLKSFDADVVPKQLEVADYICSDRVACERKTVRDFISSIFNQRIFKQLRELADSYECPVLILEGNPELLFLEERTNPNVIRGVLGSIAVDYRIPIIWTQNPKETAAQVFWMANREQVLEKRGLQIRSKRKAPGLAHQQEFLVAGLPGISGTRARALLKHFKTPEKVFTAREKNLLKLEGFGKKRTESMRKVLTKRYEPTS